MQRTSGDYAATTTGHCAICGRTIFPGMSVFNVKLKSGRRGIAHSLCENLEKTVTGVEKNEGSTLHSSVN